jgi:hypothetical protein
MQLCCWFFLRSEPMKRLFTVAAILLTTAFCSAQDRVNDLARAIAKAEGFGVKGAVPTRTHNPGDIRSTNGVRYPGQVGLNKQYYVVFKNDRAGWSALRHQIEKIIAGESGFYNVNMTLKQLGRKYATSPRWAKSIAHNLGVKPSTELWEILGVPPALMPNWSKR